MQLNIPLGELQEIVAAALRQRDVNVDTTLRICKTNGETEVWTTERKIFQKKGHGLPQEEDADWFLNGITDSCGPQTERAFTR